MFLKKNYDFFQFEFTGKKGHPQVAHLDELARVAIPIRTTLNTSWLSGSNGLHINAGFKPNDGFRLDLLIGPGPGGYPGVSHPSGFLAVGPKGSKA